MNSIDLLKALLKIISEIKDISMDGVQDSRSAGVV
jgi:hypothetical protein